MATNTQGPAPGRASRSHLTAAASPPSITKADATVTREPVILADAVAELVERSDQIDTLLRLRLAAYSEGYAAAELAHAEDYEAGFYDGTVALKRAQHEAVDLTEIEVKRWGPGGREHFADPRPDDYRGSALPLERPGQIWLAGRVVHYHECTDACRAYKPGWNKVPNPQGGAA